MTELDAIVVGSGPNGLAAAVTLARAGLSVRIYERDSTIGGGARTAEITLPGFRHDLCSAVHPMALASRFFQQFELEKRIDLRLPPASFGHPLDGGRGGVAYRDIDRTAAELGADGAAWKRLMQPLAERADDVARFTGSQLLRIPEHPLTVARFGLRVLEQGTALWNRRFVGEVAPAMLTGVAAHAIRPMPSLATAGAGLSLATYAHAQGWPIPIGGSQAIVDALVTDFTAHGGQLVTNTEVRQLDDLPSASAILLDVSPRALARIAADRLPDAYRRKLESFAYGNAVAKVDFALAGAVPWADERIRGAGTVHVGGSRAQIRLAEREIYRGRHSPSPYVLVAQPSIVDPSRAPSGKHVLWAYTHVPRGSTIDQTEVITGQIERFAPGFRDLVLASHSRTAEQMEQYDPNYVGGDIAAGEASLAQLIRRPTLSRHPWRTPANGIYLASSSTPPGPGVHGLAGWYAAQQALLHTFGVRSSPDLGLAPVAE